MGTIEMTLGKPMFRALNIDPFFGFPARSRERMESRQKYHHQSEWLKTSSLCPPHIPPDTSQQKEH